MFKFFPYDVVMVRIPSGIDVGVVSSHITKRSAAKKADRLNKIAQISQDDVRYCVCVNKH